MQNQPRPQQQRQQPQVNPLYVMSMMNNPFNPVNFMQPRLSPLHNQWQNIQNRFHASPYNQTVALTSAARQEALNDLYRAQTQRRNLDRVFGQHGLFGAEGGINDMLGGLEQLFNKSFFPPSGQAYQPAQYNQVNTSF